MEEKLIFSEGMLGLGLGKLVFPKELLVLERKTYFLRRDWFSEEKFSEANGKLTKTKKPKLKKTIEKVKG